MPHELNDETDNWLGRLGMQCRTLLQASDVVAESAGKPLASNSVAASDARDVQAALRDAPESLATAPGHYAGVYVDAMSQHLAAIADLINARRVHQSIWPLLRAELEIAGRVAWLLEPGEQSAPIGGMRRMARFLMEAVSSACRARYTAGRNRMNDEVRHAKAVRDRMRAEVAKVYPDGALDWSEPGDENDWELGGESYLTLGKAVELFSEHPQMLGGAKGVYDTLSDYAHPSLLSLSRQTDMRSEGDHLRMVYLAEPAVVEWQVKLACLILYRATHLVAAYRALDTTGLEDWADTCQRNFPTWFAGDA